MFLVLADENGNDDVAGGENKGRRLHHVAIARRIEKLGVVNARAGFSKDAPNPVSPATMRLIAFAQEPASGRVWGAAVWGGAVSAIAGSR